MSHDPVARTLGATAPVALPGILGAIARNEDLSLAELQLRLEAANAGFRAWAEDPANRGRPLSDAPDHAERIALESLLERRLFAE